MLEKFRSIIIIYNITGTLTVDIEDRLYKMFPEDLMLINPKKKLAISTQEDSLYIVFEIDRMEFSQIFKGTGFTFFCNSMDDESDDYDLLRNKLSRLVSTTYENNLYSNAEITKLEMEIIILLVSSFSVIKYSGGNDDRSEAILDYIDMNYKDSLSLEDISSHFGISKEYFSRFFKESVHMGFHKYLMQVRLKNAVYELLNTDKTLLRIAMDNGFPNIDSFNRYFKSEYGQKPSEYRKSNEAAKQENAVERMDQQNLLEAITKGSQHNTANRTYEFEIDATSGQPLNYYWKRILNLGEISRFNDSDARSQLVAIQKELKMEYIRMPVSVPAEYDEGNYSFFKEERIFSALVKMNYSMWLILDYRRVQSDRRIYKYLKDMLSFFSNRYSVERVRNWKLELRYDTQFDESKCANYFSCIKKLEILIREFGLKDALYGPNLSLGNEEGIRRFIDYIAANNLTMKVLTFSSVPLLISGRDENLTVRCSMDANFIVNRISMVQRIATDAGISPPKVYISDCGQLWSDMNPLNDTCYGGAFLAKTVIDCYGVADALSYGTPLDLLNEACDRSGFLFGASGMVTKHGLLKPMYYAMNFFNRLGKEYIAKNESSIVTASGTGNYTILCHNCKRLNYRYFLTEGKFEHKDISSFFDDEEEKSLKFTLRGIADGNYLIKERIVNEEQGSILDTMKGMSSDIDIQISETEIDYIRHMSIPKMELHEVSVDGGVLELSVCLKPNEIRHIHVIYML